MKAPLYDNYASNEVQHVSCCRLQVSARGNYTSLHSLFGGKAIVPLEEGEIGTLHFEHQHTVNGKFARGREGSGLEGMKSKMSHN